MWCMSYAFLSSISHYWRKHHYIWSVHVKFTTYPWDELSDHAGPRSIGSRNPVQPVPNQPDAVLELENICQLLQHVHTEALIAVISLQVLMVRPQHHIWILLQNTRIVWIVHFSYWLSMSVYVLLTVHGSIDKILTEILQQQKIKYNTFYCIWRGNYRW